MAGKVEQLLLEIKANVADLSKVQAELKKVRKEAKDTAKESGDAFAGMGAAFGAIAGAFAGSKIIGFFTQSAEAANRLEQSMLKVASSARAMGQSTDAATKAAQDLAKDGFMSAGQAAQALSNLMQTGLSVDQAKKFVTASKDITAFGNTIGDAAQATTDLTAGLLKGSALVIDNASPALKSLTSQYQKVLDTQGKSAAAQLAYNSILKESKKFAGDAQKSMDTLTGAQKRYDVATEEASSALGEKLQPAFKALYNIGTTIVDMFAKLISYFDSTSVSIVAGGAAIIAMIFAVKVSMVTLIPALNAVGISATATWTAMLGPIALIVAAIAGIALALHAIFGTKSGDDIVKDAKKNVAGLEEERQKILELEKVKKRSAEQNAELAQSQELLRKKAKELGVDYDALIRKTKSLADAAKELAQQEKWKALREIMKQVQELESRRREVQAIDLSVSGRYGYDRSYQQAELNRITNEQRALGQNAADLLNEPEAVRKRTDAAGQSNAKEARFIEIQQQLREIEKNYKYTINDKVISADMSKSGFTNKNSQAYKEEIERRKDAALTDAEDQAEALHSSLRQAYTEYIEDKVAADTEALNKQTLDAKRALEEELTNEINAAMGNESLIQYAKEEHEEKLQKVRIANAQKMAKIYADSMVETLNAASTMSKGMTALKNGDLSGAEGMFTGGGGLLTKLGGKDSMLGQLGGALSTAGPVVGAVVGLGSAIAGLFGKSDAEKAREAEEQKRRDEEAKALLELQANYQKNMLALQESQAKLPFENLQRNLRLTDIQAQQKKLAGENADDVEKWRLDTRLGLMQGTLSSENAGISKYAMYSDTTSDPNSLIKFLNDRNAESGKIQTAQSLMNDLANVANSEGDLATYSTTRDRINALGLSKELTGAYMNQIGGILRHEVDVAFARWNRESNDLDRKFNSNNVFNHMMSQAGALGFDLTGSADSINSLLSIRASSMSTAENLLSVIEQSQSTQLEISANTKKTAENTAKLTQIDDRKSSFLDLGNRRVFSNGLGINVDNLKIPSDAGSIVLASTAPQSVSNDTLSQLRQLVDLSNEANEYLAIIAANTDNRPGTDTSSFDNYLINKLNQIKSRRVS